MSKAVKNVARIVQYGVIAYATIGLKADIKWIIVLLLFGAAAFIEGIEEGGEKHG